MTILELTRRLTADLGGIYPEPEAAAMAGQMLEHYLELSPLKRRMQAADQIPPEKKSLIEAAQVRLLRHEPLQYVLGTAHFAGLELEVTPATLIPRPETEELVALIIQEQKNAPQLSILDIGTGSGCIPVALSQALPTARVDRGGYFGGSTGSSNAQCRPLCARRRVSANRYSAALLQPELPPTAWSCW